MEGTLAHREHSLKTEFQGLLRDAMSTSLPAVTGASSIPATAVSEIDEKLANGVLGKVLQDYAMGDIKLTMWIPSDLGKSRRETGLTLPFLFKTILLSW
jgi:hypothetical protein